MKISTFLIVFLSLFSCKKEHEGTSDCMCVGKEASDSIITITNPVFEIKDNQEFINYNCAEVGTSTARITDSTGNEFFGNLVSINCISNKTYNLKIAKKINYSSKEFKEINMDNESDKGFLVNEIKENAYQAYQFKIDRKREVVAITKIEK
ncbi:hypothetical protein LUD75_03290 [Epilithonimonas sp. JDS]|uniref:hypothetical protein n=1 Tax=Epilithonimonas sp. JDS TaxID=2902797 RepID=UPI001E2CC75F|nr:hypothetical protein [Epilithonimonas sp. JDS]MCD9853711.1 hypothetical protein [Epilithonimonas sp. JDS]